MRWTAYHLSVGAAFPYLSFMSSMVLCGVEQPLHISVSMARKWTSPNLALYLFEKVIPAAAASAQPMLNAPLDNIRLHCADPPLSNCTSGGSRTAYLTSTVARAALPALIRPSTSRVGRHRPIPSAEKAHC